MSSAYGFMAYNGRLRIGTAVKDKTGIIQGEPNTFTEPSLCTRTMGLSSLRSSLPGMFSIHILLCVLLPVPLSARNIYARPSQTVTEECISRVLRQTEYRGYILTKVILFFE